MGLHYLLTGSALSVYLLLMWIFGSVLKLRGPDLWVFRAVGALIGFLVAGLYIWYRLKSGLSGIRLGRSRGAEAGGEADEADLVIRDAEARLAASRLGPGARLSQLPVVFVVGPPGSAKTTAMVQSGLEPELLAGQVYQENAIAPTRSVNLWFARQTVFVEVAGRLLAEPDRWVRLVRRLAPGRSKAAGGKQQAPRAAVVCFDCEEFLKPGASDAVAVTVRNLHQRLGEVSQLLGISFPVYVLFTKMDRCPSSSTTYATSPTKKPGKWWERPCPWPARRPKASMPSRPASGSPPPSTIFTSPWLSDAWISWPASTRPRSCPGPTSSRASFASCALRWCSFWWMWPSPASCGPRLF